ncbi:unnamed protein product, partial [Urochloa humidicola]
NCPHEIDLDGGRGATRAAPLLWPLGISATPRSLPRSRDLALEGSSRGGTEGEGDAGLMAARRRGPVGKGERGGAPWRPTTMTTGGVVARRPQSTRWPGGSTSAAAHALKLQCGGAGRRATGLGRGRGGDPDAEPEGTTTRRSHRHRPHTPAKKCIAVGSRKHD